MIKKFRKTITAVIASLMILAPAGVPVLMPSAFALNEIANGVCTGSNASGKISASQGVSCSDSGTSINVGGIAAKAVNIFSIVVGAVAIIMIIYGGFRYITSGGDSNSVGTAKNTLIYAIIGLIIVALAQVIVHFVLNTATNSVSGSS